MKRLLLLLVAGWLAAAAYLFVWPHDDPPGRADAIVVLAGDKRRLPAGLRLLRQGVAPTIAVSDDLGRKPGLDDRICAGQVVVQHVCFRARPYSTRGEARAIARLARAHGWRRLVVVTSGFHDFRARLLIRRCYDGRLRMVAAPYPKLELPKEAVYETVKLGYALTLGRGC